MLGVLCRCQKVSCVTTAPLAGSVTHSQLPTPTLAVAHSVPMLPSKALVGT